MSGSCSTRAPKRSMRCAGDLGVEAEFSRRLAERDQLGRRDRRLARAAPPSRCRPSAGWRGNGRSYPAAARASASGSSRSSTNAKIEAAAGLQTSQPRPCHTADQGIEGLDQLILIGETAPAGNGRKCSHRWLFTRSPLLHLGVEICLVIGAATATRCRLCLVSIPND